MLYSLISQHSTFNIRDNSHNSRDKLLHISFFFVPLHYFYPISCNP